ncbi:MULTISPECIES: hypothetical protein [Bradyrhizobium]|nr:hypothetical protein [Bradyrhizobium denitrificans]
MITGIMTVTIMAPTVTIMNTIMAGSVTSMRRRASARPSPSASD